MTPKVRHRKLVASVVACSISALVLWGCEDDPAPPPPPPTQADVGVTKASNVSTTSEGDTLTYTVVVRNNGPAAAAGIVVEDILPSDVTFVSAMATSGTYSSGVGLWTVPNLAVNAAATLTIRSSVDAGTLGNMIVNTATIIASSPADPIPANNAESATTEVVVANADLALTKTVSAPASTEGATIDYTVTLTNNGPAAATSIEVADDLPAGLTLVQATASIGTYDSNTGVWTLGLMANQSAALHLRATAAAGTAGTTITNSASVTSSSANDPAPGNNDDAVSTIVFEALGGGVQADAVHLEWGGPAGRSYRLIRSLNAAPSGPNDPQAEVVYSGTATQVDDPLTGLLPAIDGNQTTYYYSLYDCTGTGPGATCNVITDAFQVQPTLVQCLRAGGYTIFWRHADADCGSDDLDSTVPDWWRTCDPNCPTTLARQMNALGVQNATTIGLQFDMKGIPVGRVLTSEFCRCFTTAELMDFGPTIEHVQDITFAVYDEPNRCAHCFERIDTPPTPGTNTAIIGHAGFTSNPPCELNTLAWSQCAIYKPQPGGRQFVRRVAVGEWATLP
jgi:uncharacterized repeat protein (TIGR01451 family)